MIVIGGGIAGITAAWRLKQEGVEVTLIEARPQVGGRLYSHYSREMPSTFDNGPHLFLDKYSHTRRLLEEMELAGSFEFPWPGTIPFALQDGTRGNLREWPLPAPLNLAAGMASFRLLSWQARFRTIHSVKKLLSGEVKVLQSIAEWLQANSQDEERRIFWEPLLSAALNAEANQLPVTALRMVFSEGLCKGFSGGRLGYAREPLGSIFGRKMEGILRQSGIDLRLNTTAVKADIENGQIRSVKLQHGGELKCDVAIAALPPWALQKWLEVIPETESLSDLLKLDEWEANPISSLYLWAEERPLLDAYTCTPGGPADWVFDFGCIWGDKRAPICLLLGNKGISRAAEEIEQVLARMTEAFPQLRAVVWKAYKLIQEKRATPLRPRELWGEKLQQKTPIPNLFLAGDWLDRELPPTVEAAVRSGERVVKMIINKV